LTQAAWEVKERCPEAAWPRTGAITFDNFSVKYRPDLPFALRGLSFSIAGGEKVGIVGRTGAGKSTISLALFRLLDECVEGRVLIDGVDIRELGLHDLRTRLTIIPQDPVMFCGPLRLNLDPFGGHTDAELWSVLEKASLGEFVQGLEGQLAFECAEGGENLSFGQRQLFCLARALLRRTRLLVLDEATAAIDHNTDTLVQKLIKTEFADCTVLTIAHRLNTILDSSRIMVLDEGRVVEFDAPGTLLADQSSYFYAMANSAGLIPAAPAS